MPNKVLGILGSVIATAISMLVINVFVNGVNEHLIGTGIAGAVWGLLIGVAIAIFGSRRPIVSGTIAATVMYVALGIMIATAVEPVFTGTKLILAVLTAVGIGAFAGYGYQLMGSRSQ